MPRVKKGETKYNLQRAHQNAMRQWLYVSIKIDLGHAFTDQPALTFVVDRARIHQGSYRVLAEKINDLADAMISAQYLDGKA